MDHSNPTFAKIPILGTGKFEQWKFRIQLYLQNEHYALWEVIEFGDSYKSPPEETGKGSLRFSKYETAKELWKAILKIFSGNEATKKTKKNYLKLQYGNFKAEGSETLEQTFNILQAIVSHLEFMDVEIEQDDLNQKFLTSLAPEWLMYTIVWRNRNDLDTMSLDDVYNHLKVYEPEVQKKSESNSQNMAFISSSNTSSGKGEVHTASVPTASTQVSTASTDVVAASLSHDTIYISPKSSSGSRLISKEVFSQNEAPSLGNALTLLIRFEDTFGYTTNAVTLNEVEADLSNMETSIQVSPTPTFRIHKDHPKSQIIGPVNTPVQTRHKSKDMEEQSFIATIHQKTNPELLQFCLFACFLSQEEPKKIFDALKDPRVRPIGTKWVLKNKKGKRGIVIRNKARLVAQGYTQEERIDYEEVLPVARIEAIRPFLAYASFMGFIVYQIYVKSAFLYGTIDEEKAMYGLHQAPRAWYGTLSKYLLDNGFQRGTIDRTLFIRKHKGEFLLVQVYVDDIIFGSSNPQLCREFEALMHDKFQMSTMGEVTFFLSLQGKDGLGKDVELHLYRSMIRSLMYLTASRPNIMFAVCACARHQVIPKECHLYTVKRIFRYLKGHPKLRLWYPKESLYDLVAYSDSDYGGAKKDRKSTTGEAEYLAAASGCGQVLWIQNQMLDYGIETTDQETNIIVTVDGKPRTIFESSFRRHLKLNDEEWISSLPNAELFENLSLMGYNILSNQRRLTKRAIRIAQSKALSPDADEPASLSRDDRQGEAFPTVSRLDAGHDRENIAKTSAMPHESSPRVPSLDANEGNIGEELGAYKSTDKGSNDTEEMVNVLSLMEAANILSSGGVAASVSPVDVFPTAGVPIVSGSFPTVSAIFNTASVVTPYTRRENQRLSEQVARDYEMARIHAEEELKLMIKGLDRSNEVIAKHLSEYEQAKADLSVGEKIELISELVKYQDHRAKILKYLAKQSKPLSKKEQREFYMSVLKSHARWKTKHFRGMTLEQIKKSSFQFGNSRIILYLCLQRKKVKE
nr:hypothetical protein [Tanacetum cinerariifolium]